MNKYPALFFVIGMMSGAPLFAQNNNLDLFKQIDQRGPDETPTPAPATTPGAPAPQEPTIITATDKSTFDGKDKVAVLYGDVHVKNPQFTLNADKLTVYFHKDVEGTKKDPGTKKSPAPTPSPTPKPGASDPGTQQGGGIEKVVAEGNVVIVSDRPDNNGGPPVHYVGKGEKVVYTPATGEAIISGWPQLQQGMNTMSATDSATVIYLYRDGTMHADGPHKMEIHDPGPDKAPALDKQSPAPDKSPEVK